MRKHKNFKLLGGTSQSGYILILTLMMMALGTAIITKLYYQVTGYVPVADLVVKREKAKMLALGGVQMAISRLSGPKESKNVSTDESIESVKRPPQAVFLERILPGLNRWDKVQLQESIDGLDGEIKICLSCEEGKINLNQWYDFTKHEFKGAVKPAPGSESEDSGTVLALNYIFNKLAALTKDQVDPKVMMRDLERFLAERQQPLYDITELLILPSWKYFQNYVFYVPPVDSEEDSVQLHRPIYLTDLFTTYGRSSDLQPWLFSDSILAGLGFSRAVSDDIIKREQAVAEWTKQFQPQTNWLSEWGKTLGLVYSSDLSNVPNDLVAFFDNRFNPQFFSVIAQGQVGQVVQRVYAIIKKQPKNKAGIQYKIEKLYWI